MTTMELLSGAKAAKRKLASLPTEVKNEALLAMADELVRQTADILAANREDLAAAKGTMSDVMLDRLALDETRIAAMADGIRQVAALPDPVGKILRTVTRPNGLVIEKRAVPMGVIAIIYESRPNVTSDAAALALKSGNVCVLRGGKEAFRSARAIVAALKSGLVELGLPDTFVNLVEDTNPSECDGTHARGGLCGSADPPGRPRTDPRLCGERNGALHPDRNRHLPRLCGCGGGCGYGGQYH